MRWRGAGPGDTPTFSRLRLAGGPGIDEVIALDRQGRSLSVVQEMPAGSSPRWRVVAPASGVARVRYRVTAAPRAEGSMKPEAQSSAIGPSWSLLAGRDLFLVPSSFERVKAVMIRLDAPAEQRAIAPWLEPGRGTAPQRVAGGLEELLATPLAFGRFALDSFAVGATRYRVWSEASIPGSERTRIVAQARAVATDLADQVRRPLGATYTVIATPTLDDLGTPTGAAWGSGQGGGASPLTTTRLRGIALSLADAYVLSRPHRFELDALDESWLAPALRNLLAERAVARARGVSRADLDRVLAYRYAMLPETMREDLDLERVRTPFPTAEGQVAAVEEAGPYVLARLDRDLAGDDPGRSRLAAALARAARHDHVRSFWSAFDPEDRERVAAFRARYVRGRELLDVSADRDPAEMQTVSPITGVPVQRVRLAATGHTLGYLEPCGCRVNQAGGVAKRARRVAELRARFPGLLLVDAGSSFGDPGQMPMLDELARAELHLYLGTMRSMGYDALAPGWSDLARGPSLFATIGTGSALPYTTANLRHSRKSLAPPARVVERDGVRARIVGVFEPALPLQRPSRLDASLDSLEIEDPVAAVRAALAGAPSSDLCIVLGELSYRAVREIARTCPEVDVIVTSPDRIRGELTANGAGSSLSPSSGFLDRAFVLYADLGEYGIETLDLGLGMDGRVVDARVEPFDLGDDVREDPAVRARLDRFYTTVTRTMTTAHVEIPDAADPERRGGYAGRQACASCHPSETAQWETTAHADAFKTLLDAHRHYQPRCVACHVVGFGTPDGYRSDSRELADVQCEACHGPGAAHARDPIRGRIAREVPERVCVSCHTPEHSDAFVYQDRLPLVAHGKRGITASRAAEETQGARR